MGKKHAYIDEFGSYGFKFESQGCATHFIITAIIVDEDDIDDLKAKLEKIRSKNFQSGEMKSSGLKNHKRRLKIIEEMSTLPFKIFSLVCDKKKFYDNSGLKLSKHSFYKYLNRMAYDELRIYDSDLTIVADQVGGDSYMDSFIKYIHKKGGDLFEGSQFFFRNSKDDVFIQVADIMSGSIAFNYDERKKEKAEGNNYVDLLKDKIYRIKVFPEQQDCLSFFDNIPKDIESQIPFICLRKAIYFINQNNRKSDTYVKQQVAIIKYLVFRYKIDPLEYIYTDELIDYLVENGFEKLSQQTFRNQIIAKLRDKDVILSSSYKGYKIPSNQKEIMSYISHGVKIIMPMLKRIKKCNDIVKMGTDMDIIEKLNLKRALETLLE